MKIENVEVYGFKAALRGMRNPMDSWDKSDTRFGTGNNDGTVWPSVHVAEEPWLGPEDLKLACKLIKAGTDHRKFLRQIMVWWDITIPRAIWQELDTYKVATVRNSCSTMHKLGHRNLTHDDFEDGVVVRDVLETLNELGRQYREVPASASKREDILQAMKMILPEGYLQRATYSFSYETGLAMFKSRSNHRMKQWSGHGGICSWILKLPYMDKFIGAAFDKSPSES